MQKVTPPASSYDAASDSDTKLIINIGIQYVILFRSMNCMKKVMLPASGGDAGGVRSCAQTKRYT